MTDSNGLQIRCTALLISGKKPAQIRRMLIKEGQPPQAVDDALGACLADYVPSDPGHDRGNRLVGLAMAVIGLGLFAYYSFFASSTHMVFVWPLLILGLVGLLFAVIGNAAGVGPFDLMPGAFKPTSSITDAAGGRHTRAERRRSRR